MCRDCKESYDDLEKISISRAKINLEDIHRRLPDTFWEFVEKVKNK